MEKKIFFFFTIISFITLTVIGIFNFVVDADYKFYKKKYFISELQKNFAEKKIIYLPKNADFRLIKRYLFNEYNDNLDILLCGPSKTASINTDFFKNKKFLNISVQAMNIDDLNNLCFDAYNKLKPKIIIIEISHDLFDNYYSNRFNLKNNQNANYTFKFLKPNFFSLLEYSYTKKNFLFLLNSLTNNFNSPDEYVELYYDGSMNLQPNIKRNYNYYNNDKDSLVLAKSENNELFKMDKNIYSQLDNILNYFSTKSEVYLLQVPLNSIFDKVSYQDNENYLIIENLLKQLEKKKINIIGSFHNSDVGCTDKDYLTVNHPNINCLKKIFINF